MLLFISFDKNSSYTSILIFIPKTMRFMQRFQIESFIKNIILYYFKKSYLLHNKKTF